MTIIVLLPGESHGQRSLVVHSPWSCRVRHDGVTNTITTAIAILLNILLLLEILTSALRQAKEIKSTSIKKKDVAIFI